MVSLKNALSLGLRGMAVIVFAVEGEIAWRQSMLMADGGMLGGASRPRLCARRIVKRSEKSSWLLGSSSRPSFSGTSMAGRFEISAAT